jgi:hypothetical protein
MPGYSTAVTSTARQLAGRVDAPGVAGDVDDADAGLGQLVADGDEVVGRGCRAA